MVVTMMAALEVEGLVEEEVAEGVDSGEEGEVSEEDGNQKSGVCANIERGRSGAISCTSIDHRILLTLCSYSQYLILKRPTQLIPWQGLRSTASSPKYMMRSVQSVCHLLALLFVQHIQSSHSSRYFVVPRS